MQTCQIRVMALPPLDYRPPMDPPNILHQDGEILVVEKPAGLLSVPGKAEAHQDCLETRLKDADPKTLLIHRLDLDTSGLMIFARNPNAQRHLGLQFERRVVKKTYTALITEQMPQAEGMIDLPLIADWPNRPLQKVCHSTGKPARTGWSTAEITKDAVRLILTPETGRSHQLRVHLAALERPIIGDRFYGGRVAERLMLHASELSFRHPQGGQWVRFGSPCQF